MTRLERFQEKYIPEPNSGCWLWTASVTGSGKYAQFSIPGKATRANRASWIMHYGDIPEGKIVLHKCDTPLCVNPNHLFLGTPKDNMQDCLRKKRHHTTGNKKRGYDRTDTKIFPHHIEKMRELYKTISQEKIAKIMGFSQARVSVCLRGRGF